MATAIPKPPKPKTTTVELNSQQYTIRRLAPAVGSFIITRILLAGADQVGAAAKDGTLANTFTTFLRGLDFDTFSFVQNSCLAVVDKLEQLPGIPAPTPMPIIGADGNWTAPEVASDLSLVMNLTIQSLLFNVSDFFDLSGLSSVLSGNRPPQTT